MSSSQTIPKDNSKREEQRSCPRQTLKHYSVLVFFGQDNWGKIADISESGMSFEFAQIPPLRQQITFGLQAMGCMPVPPEEGIFGKSFQVVGEVVWTKDFERTAGARFLEVTQESREQIRQWLSFEAANRTLPSGKEIKQKSALLPEPFAPQASPSETVSEMGEIELSSAGLEATESIAEPEQGLELPLVEEIREEFPEAPVIGAYDIPAQVRLKKTESAGRSNRPVVRLTFIGVAVCLAVLAVIAGVKIILPSGARRAEAVERAASPTTGRDVPTGIASSPSAQNAAPFQVEVLDVSGKRLLLSFVHSAAKNGSDQVASISAGSSNSHALAKKSPSQKQTPSVAEARAAGEFTLAAPRPGLPDGKATAANVSSPEAPALSVEFAASLGEPIVGAAANRAVPPPPADSPRIGGEVQQARLIRSVPPAYPPIAKANRVSGDVVMDALIDSDGKVTSAKIISGPVLLQQAALEAIRQWKYAPARLDGQPVAMHLTVTMKFRTAESLGTR